MNPWPGERPPRNYRVAVVDDEENNLMLFRVSLVEGPFDVETYGSGTLFLDSVAAGRVPDILLLDVMMPYVDGFEVCRRLRARPETEYLPIILVTGLDDTEFTIRGLQAGADDYLAKPFHPMELMARMRALLRVSFLTEELKRKNVLLADDKLHLEQLVRERTSELEGLTLSLVTALEKANEMNDSDTGLHLVRVSSYSRILAEALGLPPGLIFRIARYASLHDVGKVAIPDHLLKKPGTLTAEEFDQMKLHTVYGYELLKVANVDPVAQNIAYCHHEKFNGNGYPRGLAGEDIPVEARVVAMADVFDALTTKRCYKREYDLETSRGIILAETGHHFDPRLVEAQQGCWDRFVEVFRRYGDEASTA
ncbi:MAG: response regulator [Deltaproteobacteria bacterium]|nr:response regulator [Deltaproteobacteria bacterium]